MAKKPRRKNPFQKRRNDIWSNTGLDSLSDEPTSVNPRLAKKARSIKRLKAESPKNPWEKGLLKCDTVEKVHTWHADHQRKFGEKAVKAIAKRKIDDGLKAIIAEFASGTSATSDFTMANGKLNLELMERVGQALHDLAAANPELEFGMLTVIDGKGGTSLYKPVIELVASQAKVKSTVRKISPDYFGLMELALFNSITHPEGGAHIQRHEHVLVWGTGLKSKANAAILKDISKYADNVTEARVLDFTLFTSTDLVNLTRMSAYLTKAPSKALNWCPPRDGKKGHMNKSEKGDRLVRFLRMLQLRSMLTFDDCVIASGEGQTIKRNLRKLLGPMAVADAPPSRRLLTQTRWTRSGWILQRRWDSEGGRFLSSFARSDLFWWRGSGPATFPTTSRRTIRCP